VWLWQHFALRGGVNNWQRALDDIDGSRYVHSLQPNAGAGLRWGPFALDYALTDLGNASQVLYSHVVSVHWNIRPRALRMPARVLERPQPGTKQPRIIYEQID
jgi:hypothetical protein